MRNKSPNAGSNSKADGEKRSRKPNQKRQEKLEGTPEKEQKMQTTLGKKQEGQEPPKKGQEHPANT